MSHGARTKLAEADLSQYARARSRYAPVARSTSTRFPEERASARRWTRDELAARIGTSSRFRFDSPSADVLDRLVQHYRTVTGENVHRSKQRNLLATCYRVHGEDVFAYISDQFAVHGTANNLLGIIRSEPPREPGDDASRAGGDDALRSGERPASQVRRPVALGVDHEGPPCPLELCWPEVIFCYTHFPAFDPHSHRRYDRHRSNPDAAIYFADQASNSGDSGSTTGTDGAE